MNSALTQYPPSATTVSIKDRLIGVIQICKERDTNNIAITLGRAHLFKKRKKIKCNHYPSPLLPYCLCLLGPLTSSFIRHSPGSLTCMLTLFACAICKCAGVPHERECIKLICFCTIKAAQCVFHIFRLTFSILTYNFRITGEQLAVMKSAPNIMNH